MANKIIKWLRIVRLHTLTAAFCPVFIGLLVASKTCQIDWTIAIVTLLCAMAIQILANLVNDIYDYKRGADKRDRSGYKRALAQGEVSVESIKRAIKIDICFCILLGAFLILKGGVPILLIGLFSLLFAWLYTATKHSLSYLGMADIFVLLFFGPIASCGTTFLQTHTFSFESMLLGLACGSLATCVLVVNNIRDYIDDKSVQKKTLTVRLGKKFSYAEYLFFMLLAVAMDFVSVGFVLKSWCVLLVVAVIMFILLLKCQEREYNDLLAKTGLINVLFCVLKTIDVFAL